MLEWCTYIGTVHTRRLCLQEASPLEVAAALSASRQHQPSESSTLATVAARPIGGRDSRYICLQVLVQF